MSAHLEFIIRDEERARVSQVSGLGAAVFILQQQTLEHLPPGRIELPHVGPHVLVLVERVHHCVELKGDAKGIAQLPHSEEMLDMLWDDTYMMSIL